VSRLLLDDSSALLLDGSSFLLLDDESDEAGGGVPGAVRSTVLGSTGHVVSTVR
jgi:hypothetical protein